MRFLALVIILFCIAGTASAQYGPWRYGFKPGASGFAPYFPPEEAAEEAGWTLPQFANTLVYYEGGDYLTNFTYDVSFVGTNHAVNYNLTMQQYGVYNPGALYNSTVDILDVSGSNMWDQIKTDTVGSITWWAERNVDAGDRVMFAIGADATLNPITYLCSYFDFAGDRVIWRLRKDGTDQWDISTPNNWTDDKVGVMHMYTLVHNGTNPVIYFNGKPLAGLVTNAAVDLTAWYPELEAASNPATTVSLGGLRISYISSPMELGRVSEFAMWDSVLTDSEILEMFENMKYQVEGRTNSGMGYGYPNDYATNNSRTAHITFDYINTGVVADMSGNHNRAINTGGSINTNIVGAFRTSTVNLDGVNDYVTLPQCLTGTVGVVDNLSISLWAMSLDTNTVDNMAAFTYVDDGIGIFMRANVTTDGDLQFFVNNDQADPNLVTNYVMSLYDFKHLGIVAEDGVNGWAKFYIDGQLVASNAVTGNFTEYGTPASRYLGVRRGAGAGWFKGVIDDVIISTNSISDSEMQAIYDNTKYKYEITFPTYSYNPLVSYEANVSWAVGYDTTTNKNHAPVANQGTSEVNYDGGVTNGVMDFDGVTPRYIQVPVNVDTNGFSISAWIKPGNDTSYSTISSRGLNESYRLIYSSDLSSSRTNTVGLVLYGANSSVILAKYTENLSIPFDQWSFVTATYTNDTGGTNDIRVYVNGQESFGFSADLGFTYLYAGNDDHQIGATDNSGTDVDYFKGLIDVWQLYPGVLTPTEVTNLFNSYKADYGF